MKSKEILQKWKETTIGEFCPFEYGKGLPERNRNISGNISVYGSNGIVGHHDKAITKNSTIIIGRKGTIGKVNFSKTPCWPIDTTFFIRPDNSRNMRFTYYLLQTLNLQNLNSDSAVPGLNRERTHKISILVPTLMEQQKIASILSNVDSLIRQTQKIIGQTRRLRKGLMQKILTRGIGHTKFKKTILGEIPESWNVVKLKDVAKKEPNAFVAGPFGSNLKVQDYTVSGIRLIQLQNIQEGDFDSVNEKYTSEEKFQELRNCAAYPGDVLVAKMADPIARACIAPKLCEQYLLVADCVRINVDKSKFDSIFVMYEINSSIVRRQAIAQGTGSTRLRISLSALRQIKFPEPPLAEQQKITSVLSSVDSLIQQTQKYKSKLETLKKGLMQKLLTGRIRVKA